MRLCLAFIGAAVAIALAAPMLATPVLAVPTVMLAPVTPVAQRRADPKAPPPSPVPVAPPQSGPAFNSAAPRTTKAGASRRKVTLRRERVGTYRLV